VSARNGIIGQEAGDPAKTMRVIQLLTLKVLTGYEGDTAGSAADICQRCISPDRDVPSNIDLWLRAACCRRLALKKPNALDGMSGR